MPLLFVAEVFLLSFQMNGPYKCDIDVPMSQRVMALQSDVTTPSRELHPECSAQSRRSYNSAREVLTK